MANTIKHKRASGSNPSASDLVVGELAIRTDTGVVFTKKDDNSVAEIAGGGETNLGVSTTTTAVTVTSDTGNNATISEASGSAAGVMSVAHHDKLDGIASSATNVTNTNQLTNGAGFITATLTEEQVEDFVGGMVTGNTETGITVTYQDSDGTLDFAVTSQTDNNFTTTLKNKLDGIAASATNVTNNNQITNGASYVTSSVINSLNASNLSSGTVPDARFPSTLPAVSGANLTNIAATVASGCIYENSQTISSNYSITSGKNAMSAGPITVASGVTVTVTSGSTWTVV